MKVTCPNCRTVLLAAQLNVAKDVAVCQNCSEAFSISAVVSPDPAAEDFNLDQPPRGAWFEDTGSGWRLGATTRSPAAFFLVPFMCVWSGLSLGGIYGSQVIAGEFNLLASLFGIPFLLGTLLIGSATLMCLFGKVNVSVEGNEGRIFTGIGFVGWTRRFDWSSISKVEEGPFGYGQSGSNSTVISLVGKSRIKFGSMVSDARRYYLIQALRKLLALR